MAEFKVVIADPKTGRAYNVDASGGAAGALVGKKIGEEVDAGPLGLAGYKMQITGGSDRTGTPANSSLPGAGRKKLLVAGGTGYHPKMDGQRRRKMLRSKEITADFVQINAKLTGYGEKKLEEIFPAKQAKEGKEGEAPAAAAPPAKTPAKKK
ncbi:MAG: 30S ribosomal protein S6e [Methanoregula sp. PtaU1.Bin051]|nr:MAG: 30S ribosomal protein S6e [Methanoregula sp. PtaU1.Bin051]